ncbi:MAG: helix-hairpin-helix domain-containing protein [Paludibacter sp.]|nr:helix-hairpin-helix domain-containing protein [Paludibacter sp.]
MGIKDFFYFTKGQRIGISVLIVLIIVAFLLNIFLPKIIKTDRQEFNSQFNADAELFKQNLLSLDSIRQAQWQQQYEERYRQNYTNWNANKTFSKSDTYTLFNFNPNTLDSAGFVRLGLKPYIASNILKYRQKGGKFNEKSDFAKIYGISDNKFNELEKYIIIENKNNSQTEPKTTSQQNDNQSFAENIIVDLNIADTTELMLVRGIGRYYAKGIVSYRKQLGGFASIEQLMELKNMRTENYEKIKNSFTVDIDKIQKIKINTASVERLKSHPYIGFYRAQKIYEFRRQKGKLQNINDLKKEFINEKDFTADWYQKVTPYLSFE